MKMQNEIVKRIREFNNNGKDFLGFQRSDLLGALDFDHAKEFLKPEANKKEWNKEVFTLKSDKDVKKAMSDYMEFAWNKANNCRGISAGRSMAHYSAWTWLLGDEIYNQFYDLEEYQYYGKDNLVKLCEFLGLDSKKWDDGVRTNTDY